MSKPILYKANETNFFHLGLGVLSDALNCFVYEERNGSFYLEMETLINSASFKELVNNRIIKADAGHELKDQRFVIKKITKTHKGVAKIYAEHISYQTVDMALRPEVTIAGNGSTAMQQWKNALVEKNLFEVDSDVTVISKTVWTIQDVKNAREALGGVRGSILDRWGGEFRFDNRHISLKQQRGSRARTIIAYGRNLTDLEQEENISSTVTSIYPYATKNDNGKDKLYTIPEFFVDSEYVNQYPNRKIELVDFSDEFSDKQIPNNQRLRELAKRYIKANQVGIPKVSMHVQFIDLSKTMDYKEIAPYEQLNLCDIVPVYYEKLGIHTEAKVVRVKWNVLTDSYDEIEIGDIRTSLAKSVTKPIENLVKQAQVKSTVALSSANGKNTNFYGTDRPEATKINDVWFKNDGENTIMYIWDGTTWIETVSTKPNEVFMKEFREQATTLDEVKKQAKEAIDKSSNTVNKLAEQNKQLSDLTRDFKADKETTSAAFKQLDDKLSMTVSKTYVDEQTGKLNENISKVTQSNDSLVSVVGKLEKAVDGKVTQSEYSSFVQQVNTLQTTVRNKADKSQVSQLADQYNSIVQKVESLHEGRPNLILASRYPYIDASTLKQEYRGEYSAITLNEDHLIEVQKTGGKLRLSRKAKLTAEQYYKQLTFSAKIKLNEDAEVLLTTIYYSGSGASEIGRSTEKFSLKEHEEQVVVSITQVKGSCVYMEYIFEANLEHVLYVDWVKLENAGFSNVKNTAWRPADEELVTQTQITQTYDKIMLTTIQKGKIIAQLNQEAGQTLIQNKKLYLDAESVFFSGKAFIPSAAIKELSVDKLSSGTLNAANINVVNLNGNSLVSKSVTGDKLATNAIQVGLNRYSDVLSIDPNSLNFSENGQLSGRLTGKGLEFWYGSRYIGSMGHGDKLYNQNIRGIAMHLESTGDYIAWGYRENAAANAYTDMLTLDPRGAMSGYRGIHADSPFFMNDGFGVAGYEPLTFSTSTIGLSIGFSGAASRLLFGMHDLYYLVNYRNEGWTRYSIEDAVITAAKLKGLGSIIIPTSLRSDGMIGTYKEISL
ncbi:hypothetical protein IGJ41_000310 [Enterococcus sp. DIV1537a]|uniref:phage tail spike protein n=1 Tax=Enterococcus sp. DIV1537a TaxID=2774733 RepID=UPI003F217371